MSNTSIYKYIITILITSCITFQANAHYGPRGLTGGSIHVGIKFNGIVYLGTKDAGVFESTNNQLVAWRLRAVGLKSGRITALAHSGKQLYAATADSGIYIFNGAIGTDLYWNKRNNGLSNLSILSLATVDTNTILAGSNGGGLFKSTDKGLNWTGINSAVLNGKEITALTKGGNRFFALVADGGVFASNDSGATWFDLNDANTLNIIESEHFSFNTATNELLVSNDNGLFILKSAHTTTSPVYTPVQTGLPTGIHIHGLDNNQAHWYIASHSGVFATDTGIINWTAANTGINTTNIGAIVALDTNLIAGTEKNGVFKSKVSTINFSSNNSSMTNVNVYSVAGKGDSLVVTATEYGVTVSKEIGLNPKIRNNGITDSLHVNDVEIVGNMLIAATANSGVFISTDEGLNWSAQNNGLTTLNIKRIAHANGRKYVIDAAGKVFQSDVAATTWISINSGLPNNTMANSLGFYSNQMILGTYGNGVFIKYRDSANWVAFNTGLSNLNVTGVTSSAGKIFAGTDGSGVFVTNANTAAWTATAAISIPHFNNVPLNPNSINYLTSVKDFVIATYRGGIVGTHDGGTTWVTAGNQFNLPSYSKINKVSFVTSRVFLTTETNNAQNGGISELEFVDTLLVVNEQSISAPIAGITSYHDITSNINWRISALDSWITLSLDSGAFSQRISIQIAPNNGASRSSFVTLTDGGTLIRKIMVNQDGSLGISNNELTNAHIFPNPFQNELFIQADPFENTFAVLSDISGKAIKTIPLHEGILEINTSALEKGIYFLQMVTDGKIHTTKKLIKAE